LINSRPKIHYRPPNPLNQQALKDAVGYVGEVRGRRLQQGMRWKRHLTLLSIVIFLLLVAQIVIVQLVGFANPDVSAFLRPVLLVALFSLIPVAITWRRYRRSAGVQQYHEVVGRLAGSSAEYCLILRPFGSDGEIVLPYAVGGAATIEQVIARAARKSLRLRTYAVVDQKRRLAPPGPVYVQVPHDQWKPVVLRLIRRAHSIVMILPPGQDFRESFKWEVDQLSRHDLQSRVIIVLPPDKLYQDDHARAFAKACVLAAVFEGFAGSIDDVDSFRVHDFELSFPPRTHVLKYVRPNALTDPELYWWYPKESRGPWVRFYLHALTQAFSTTERELSNLDLRARYPWHSPSS
jgi:hypothetical protein